MLSTVRLGDAPDTNHLKDGLKLNLMDAAGNDGDENEYRCEPGHNSRNESLCAALAFITVIVMDERSAMVEHGLDVIIDTQWHNFLSEKRVVTDLIVAEKTW
jgi:hypothetical protein